MPWLDLWGPLGKAQQQSGGLPRKVPGVGGLLGPVSFQGVENPSQRSPSASPGAGMRLDSYIHKLSQSPR